MVQRLTKAEWESARISRWLMMRAVFSNPYVILKKEFAHDHHVMAKLVYVDIYS